MNQLELQENLARFNRSRLRPALPDQAGPHVLSHQATHQRLELSFLQVERSQVSERARRAPRDARAFVRWFEQLRETGPGQNDDLFPWLANQASIEEMSWFLRQEVAGEAGFDDLVALSQLQLPHRPKLEMARNYWDEMGRGNPGGMHGPMLSYLAQAMHLPEVPIVSESIALGNLMMGLACNRHYAYHAIGALGVIELTAPGRALHVNNGMKRLSIAADVRRYFAVHATLDVQHSLAWNEEVLLPLVQENPEVAPALAEGALMRLNAGMRCFRRYRKELWQDARIIAAQ